jgi:RimJ/RimL family protein N-acetyltransferase
MPLRATGMKSPEVTLRVVTAADLPILFKQQLEPEAVRMAAFPSRSHDAFMAHWQKIMGTPGPVLRTIEFQREVAGNIVAWEGAGEWNIGYWIGKEYWGQGIATVALRAFLSEITHRPLTTRVSASNLASIRVLEKNGFKIAGAHEFTSDDGKAARELILILKE